MNKLLHSAFIVATSALLFSGCELVNTGDDNSVDTEIQDNHSINTGDVAVQAAAATNEPAVAE